MSNLNLTNIEGTIVRFVTDKVEAKVKAATTAATISAFVLSVVGQVVFHGGAAPDWAQTAVETIVTGALTFVAGWLARHTPRTVPTPPVPPAAPAAPAQAPPATPSNPAK